MHWSRMVTLIGAHAEGEIGYVVTGGVGDIKGETMREKCAWLNGEGDGIRRFCLYEPRGNANMTVNLLLPPCNKEADFGFIPMQVDGAHAMSGSNALCVTTVLLETGMLPIREKETYVKLDTPAGLIVAKAHCENGKVESVCLDMPVSFVSHQDHILRVPDIGDIYIDIAFGGAWFIIVNPDNVGLTMKTDNIPALIGVGDKIKEAANRDISVKHPEFSELNHIEYCIFIAQSPPRAHDDCVRHYVNANIMAPGRLDRSPCGTGSAAGLALMHARGEIDVDQSVIMRSLIGGRFDTCIRETTYVKNIPAIKPQIRGRAWIYSIVQHGVDPSDPFRDGYTLPDLWGALGKTKEIFNNPPLPFS